MTWKLYPHFEPINDSAGRFLQSHCGNLFVSKERNFIQFFLLTYEKTRIQGFVTLKEALLICDSDPEFF